MLRGLVALPILISVAVPPGPDSAVARVNGVPLQRWEAERELASRIPGSATTADCRPKDRKSCERNLSTRSS